MKLQELKEQIIKDEIKFIIEMYENTEPNEIEETIIDVSALINSYQTPNELVTYYIRKGFNGDEAVDILFKYLIESE